MVEQTEGPLPPEVKDARSLTPFAVTSRYPNLDEAVTPDEYRQAVVIAEAVVSWAERRILGEVGNQ